MHSLPRNTTRFRFVPGALAAILLLATAACGSDDSAKDAAEGDDTAAGTVPALPAPEGTTGSVTGMPANPGPGTSRIVPVEPEAIGATPVDRTWPDDTQGGIATVDHPDALAPGYEADDPGVATAPERIIPGVPVQPVATGDRAGVPSEVIDAPATTRPPIGTEAATESTTLVIEPDDTGGSG